MARSVIADGARRLRAAGVDSARTDAELLAAFVLDTPRSRLALIDQFPPESRERYEQLIEQRANRVPLQHLTGRVDFAGVELAVGPGVFTPRPETELLVAWGLKQAKDAGDSISTVVDLCSGSGAIACAVADGWPTDQEPPAVYAVEADPEALRWLRRNAEGRGVRVVEGDATDSTTLTELDATVDLVLTNPPYVPTTVILPPEVAGFDPAMALFGGVDGLEVIRSLVERAARLLRTGGGLAMEHDDTHGVSVPELLNASGAWAEVVDHVDLAGRPRFVTATRV